MINLVGGIVLIAASIGLIMLMRSRDGTPHRFATMPFMQTTIPVAITGGIVLGGAMFISGVLEVSPF